MEKRGEVVEVKEIGKDFVSGSKKLLVESVQTKISYYLTKSKVSDYELYSVAKDFFLEILEIKKEITCKELKEHLNKIYMDNVTRDKTYDFLDKLSLIEYKDDPYSEEEIRNLFHEFEYIVESIFKNVNKNERKNFLDFLFRKRKKDKVSEIPNKGEDEIIKRLEKLQTSLLTNNESNLTQEKQEEKNQIAELNPENKKIEINDYFNLDQALKADKKNIESNIIETNINNYQKSNIKNYNEEKIDTKTKKIIEELIKINSQEILPKDYNKVAWTENVDISKQNYSSSNKNKKSKIQSNEIDWTEDIPDLNGNISGESSTENNEEIDSKKRISNLIKNAKKINDKQKLKEKYVEIKKLYELLSEDEKHEFFDKVNEIYKKLKLLK